MPRTAGLSLILLAGALASAPCLPAQHVPVRGSAAVVGTMRDSVSGAPLVTALVGARCGGCGALTNTDSAGAFRLGSLPAGPVTVVLFCPTLLAFPNQYILREVVVDSAAVVRLDVRVPPGICVEPPYAERTGVFRGHWTPGFEDSGFVPCRDSALGLAGGLAGLLPGQRRSPPSAWATFAQPTRGLAEVEWPEDAPWDRWGRRSYYVEWHATLRGPGSYGHFGVAAFEVVVDSVIAVRSQHPEDCR